MSESIELSVGKKSWLTKLVRNRKITDAVLKEVATTANVPLPQVKAFLMPEDKSAQDEMKLYLERRLLQHQEDNRVLRTDRIRLMKFENVRDVLREELITHCKAFPPLPSAAPVAIRDKVADVEEDLVMHISDEHADQIVMPHQVNGLEEYNLSVALRRAEVYVDSVIKFTQETMKNYRFKRLWILKYGDHVNGEIHKGTETSTMRNSFANAIAVGQMHALMTRDLAPYFDKVTVISIPGNHGRTDIHKDYHNALRNLDYLVHEVAAMRCADLKNVEHIIPDAFSANVEINGYNFNISHGDDISGNAGTPWYGIERRNNRLQAIHSAQGRQIHYKVMGHFHKSSMVQDHTGESITNGSWKATDEYLYNKIGAYVEPVQWIHGVHADHGVTWRLPVHLKTPGDAKGPSRYKLQFACQEFQRLTNNGK